METREEAAHVRVDAGQASQGVAEYRLVCANALSISGAATFSLEHFAEGEPNFWQISDSIARLKHRLRLESPIGRSSA